MSLRFSITLGAIAALALVGCDSKPSGTTGKDTDPKEVKLGTLIITKPDYPQAATPDATPNPITVPLANVIVIRKLDLSPEVDGAIKWIGVETDETTASKLEKKDVYTSRDNIKYRRLEPGDIVKRGQIIAFLDDEQAYLQHKAAAAKAVAAKDAAKAYETTVSKLKEIVAQTEDGVRRNIIPKQELLNSQATLARYQADLVEKEGSASVAAEEAATAKNALDKRTLRAAIDGEVQQVLKHEGEGVKGAGTDAGDSRLRQSPRSLAICPRNTRTRFSRATR